MEIGYVENGVKYFELLSLVQEEVSNWQKELPGRYADLFRLYAYCLRSLCYDVLDDMKEKELIFSATNDPGIDSQTKVVNELPSSRHNLLASYEDFLITLRFTFAGIAQYNVPDLTSGFETDPNDFKHTLLANLLSSFSITQEMSVKRNYFGVQQILVRAYVFDPEALRLGIVAIKSCMQFSITEKKWQVMEEDFFLQGNYIETVIGKMQDIFPCNSCLVEQCGAILKQMWLQRKVFHLHEIDKSSL